MLWEALTELCWDSENGEETLLDAMRDICDLLPAEAMRDSLWDESHRKAALWGAAISEFSPNRVLSIFTQRPPGSFLTCPQDSGGRPDYQARVATLAAMDPPETDTFMDRALNEPWRSCPTRRRSSS